MPLSLCHVLYMTLWVHVTCAVGPFPTGIGQKQPQAFPLPLPPKKLSSLCQGMSSQAEQKWQPHHSAGWAVSPGQAQIPVCMPCPWLPSAEQGQAQGPTGAR